MALTQGLIEKLRAEGISQATMDILADEEYTDENSLKGITFEQCRTMGVKGGPATTLARLFGAQQQVLQGVDSPKEVRFVSGRPEELKTPELVDRVAAALEKSEQPDPREVAELTRRLPGTAFLRNLATGLLDAAASKEMQGVVGAGVYPAIWKGLPTESLGEVLKRKIFANPFTRAGIYDPTDQWLQVCVSLREVVLYALRIKHAALDEDNTLVQIQATPLSQRWIGWHNEWQALSQKTDAQSMQLIAHVRAALYLQEGGQQGSRTNPFSVSDGIEREIAPVAVASLNGQQQKQLREALLSAFPSHGDLEQIVAYGMNERLSSIAGGRNLGQTVYELVRWAMARGRLSDLISAATRANSGNAQLTSFVRQFTAPPVMVAESRIQCGRVNVLVFYHEAQGKYADAFEKHAILWKRLYDVSLIRLSASEVKTFNMDDLAQISIAFLLTSPDLQADDQGYELIKHIAQYRQSTSLQVIPIVVEACSLYGTVLETIQTVPRNGNKGFSVSDGATWQDVMSQCQRICLFFIVQLWLQQLSFDQVRQLCRLVGVRVPYSENGLPVVVQDILSASRQNYEPLAKKICQVR